MDEAQLVQYVERITRRVCPSVKVGSGEHPLEYGGTLDLAHVYLGDQEVGMYQAEVVVPKVATYPTGGPTICPVTVLGWVVYRGVETPSSTIRGVPSDPGDWEYKQLMETVNVGEAVKRMVLAYVESVIDDCYTVFSEDEEEEMRI